MAREAASEFAKVRNRFGATGQGPAPRRLVGVAGTVTTLAALSAGLDKYDGTAIHLRRLTLDEVCGADWCDWRVSPPKSGRRCPACRPAALR